MRLAARIAGVGLVGPGFDNWSEAREILAGRREYAPRKTTIPPADALPAVERRRAGTAVRLALAAGLAACADANRAAKDMAAIFTSSTGDGHTLHEICEALASEDRLISPTRFHNSVHNAPAGYWGIATGAMGPSDSVAAFDGSFGAGLLEAMARVASDPATAVVLIAYDAPYPEPLHAKRPLPDSFGLGLVLRSPSPLGEGGGRGASLTLEVSKNPPTELSDPALELIRRGIPAARSLPLLRALALGGGNAVIEYLQDTSLQVAVTP